MTIAKRLKHVLTQMAHGTPALVGKLEANSTYTVIANGNPNEIYVRLFGDENRVVTALNHRVSAYPNLPILIRRSESGFYEVLGVNGLEAETFAGASTPSFNVPRLQGNLVSTTWETSQLMPCKIRALNGSDLWVYAEKAVYGDSVIGGVFLDLSDTVATITSGNKALVVVCIDTSTNELSATKGDDTPLEEQLTLQDAVAITIPSGKLRLAAYIIQANATSLPTSALAIDGNYYFDLRTFIGVPTAGGGGTGTGWTTAQLRYDDFYATVGTFGTYSNSSQHWTYWAYNTSGANGDVLKSVAYLPVGNYTLKLLAYKDTNLGITDVTINGAVEASLDLYNATLSFNYETTIPFTASTDGEQTIELVMNGKNASSSGYLLAVTRIWIYPS